MSEKRAPMPYTMFEKFMNIIIHDYHIADAIYQASDKTVDLYEVYQSIGGIVDLLNYLFRDAGDWIGYYVWELDCGKDYKPGMITEKGGNKEIPLATIKDLYNLLTDNFNEGLN